MMKYKSFETQKQKIREIFESVKVQTDNINIQKEIHSEIDSNVVNSRNKLLSISRPGDYSSEWENADVITTVSENITTLSKAWSIDVGIIPEDWIPFIKVDFLIQNGQGEITSVMNTANLSMSSFFEVNDTSDEDFRQVNVLASIQISDNNGIDPYQFKLSVYLYNPYDFH
jgi:hypothetical protein